MKKKFNSLAERAGMNSLELSALIGGPYGSEEGLKFMHKLIEGLEGSYNKAGIKRWFERPRTELRGLSPRILMKSKRLEDKDKLLKLARSRLT